MGETESDPVGLFEGVVGLKYDSHRITQIGEIRESLERDGISTTRQLDSHEKSSTRARRSTNEGRLGGVVSVP